jgi:predicted ATPase
MHGSALALRTAAMLAYLEGNPAEVERLASEAIELSTRQNFAQRLSVGTVYRGWACCASGTVTKGLAYIEEGLRDYRATGSRSGLPYYIAIKAEALHLADRSSEALEIIREAERLGERLEERWWHAELCRLRGVFLATLRADENQIETSFCEAIKIAREQKTVSLEKRAEGTYAEYRAQKSGSVSGERFPTTSLLTSCGAQIVSHFLCR